MDNDRLNERLARLEGQVSRLLTALCGALGIILVFIFHDKREFLFHEGLLTLFIRIAVTIGLSFMVGWPIVRWVVGKKSSLSHD